METSTGTNTDFEQNEFKNKGAFDQDGFEDEYTFTRSTAEPVDWRTGLWISVIIWTLSTTVNSIVLKVYNDRKKDMNKRFVVVLAVVDIAACWSIRLFVL